MTDNDSETSLLAAAKAGDLQHVQRLLRTTAAVNVQNADGFTPLHLATARGHADVAAALAAPAASALAGAAAHAR